MKERIIEFFNKFSEAEVKILDSYTKPNLVDYNNSVDNIAEYVIDELKFAFGARLNELRDDFFYESVKEFPLSKKRTLFRVDEFETASKKTVYKCFISNANPIRASLFGFFIVSHIDGQLKITSKYNCTDRGMGEYNWHYRGGKEEFMQKVNEEYLLNKVALGTKIKQYEILEPIIDNTQIKETYNE